MDEISVNSHLKHTKPDLQLNGLIFKKVGDTDTGLEKVETKKINEIGFFGVKNNFWSGIDKLYFSTGTHIYKFNKKRGFSEQIRKINELENDNEDVKTALKATKPIQDLNKDVKTSKINQIDIHHLNFGIYQRKILSSKYFKLTDDFLGIKEDGNKICLYSSKSANKFCFFQGGCSISHNYLDEIFKSDDGYFAYSNVTQGSNAYIWEERAKITEHYPDPKNNTLNDCFKFLKSLADASNKIETKSLEDRSKELTFTFDDKTERKLNFEKFFKENLKLDQFNSHASSIEKLKNWSPDQSIPGNLTNDFKDFLTQFKNRFDVKKASSSTSTEVKYTARNSKNLHFIPFIEVDTEIKEIQVESLPSPVLPPPNLQSPVPLEPFRIYSPDTHCFWDYSNQPPLGSPPEYNMVMNRSHLHRSIRNVNPSYPLPTPTPTPAPAPRSSPPQTLNSPEANKQQLNFTDQLSSEVKRLQEFFQEKCDELSAILLENWNKLFPPAPTQSPPNHTPSHTPLHITYYQPPNHRILPPVKDRYNGSSAPNPPQILRYEQRPRQEYEQRPRQEYEQRPRQECEQLPDITKQVPTISHSFPRENPYSDRPIIQPGRVLQSQPPNIQTLHPQPTYAQAPVFPTSYTLHQAPVFPTLNTLHQAQVPQNLYTTPAQQFPTPYVHAPFRQTPYVQAPFVLNSHAPTPQLPTPYVHAPFRQTPYVQAPFVLNSHAPTPQLPTPYVHAPFRQTPYVQAPTFPTTNLHHQQNSMPYITPLTQTYPQLPPNPQIIPINNKTNLNAYYHIQCGSA